MLLIATVKNIRRNPQLNNSRTSDWRQKLYHLRSDIPSITHIDYTARLQTVHKETNPRYWRLISAFKDKTGYGVIVNTSFNVRGEPIVCTPDDAYKCFMRTEMDYLIMGDCLFDKKKQTLWDVSKNWNHDYAPD